MMMKVPSRMRVVRAAAAARMVSSEGDQESTAK
jgi:hypothetical protein